jgi:hypothetical protein
VGLVAPPPYAVARYVPGSGTTCGARQPGPDRVRFQEKLAMYGTPRISGTIAFAGPRGQSAELQIRSDPDMITIRSDREPPLKTQSRLPTLTTSTWNRGRSRGV